MIATAPIISIEDLSKQYRVGVKRETAGNFREAALAMLTAPVRRLKNLRHGSADDGETFWALRDVNVQIKPGEVIGVIGRNGAGKSTLLKILSRITEPSSGLARLRGRVASLLEVGTGFHPELTGRENIYLNGAILGMRKREIDAKFDAIVAFAEVEKFLDTAVKYYSSGMYVRLAFAVAAHLEPEILIVDEVLAVGDAAFQKKCLGRMGNVARDGRTILFVSHNMAAVKQLCQRAVWLAGGQVKQDGPAHQVVDDYLRSLAAAPDTRLDLTSTPRDGHDGQLLRITAVVINNHQPLRHGMPMTMRIEYEVRSDCEDVSVGLGFRSLDGIRIVSMDTDLENEDRPSFRAGTRGAVEVTVPYLELQPGTYVFDVGARSGERFCLDYLTGCCQIDVEPGPATPTSILRHEGGMRVRGNWQWNK